MRATIQAMRRSDRAKADDGRARGSRDGRFGRIAIVVLLALTLASTKAPSGSAWRGADRPDQTRVPTTAFIPIALQHRPPAAPPPTSTPLPRPPCVMPGPQVRGRNVVRLDRTAAWRSKDGGEAMSIAWADVDGDADLDLAVGFSQAPIHLYLNQAGQLASAASLPSEERIDATSLAWGDVDGDGDLDLAVGNAKGPNRLYVNREGALDGTARVFSQDADVTTSVAWGDVDGDGDLDLAVGNQSGPNRVYLNHDGLLDGSKPWTSWEQDATTSVAWGDVDGNGDLDLAVGNRGKDRVYMNLGQGRGLAQRASWSSEESDATSDATKSLAWGDVDSDGDLDLAVGNAGGQNRVYRNLGGNLERVAKWRSDEEDKTQSVAWGDMDGDGDLDLVVGNAGQPNRVYLNRVLSNGDRALQTQASWRSDELARTNAVAWGDVDADGDLDLAAGLTSAEEGAVQVFKNAVSTLTEREAWASDESDSSTSLAWGDVDNDGDLDLAVGNLEHVNRVYRNLGAQLEDVASWWPKDGVKDGTDSVAWGDVDNDGDLDLAVGNTGGPNRVYLNYLEKGRGLERVASWSSDESDETRSVAWGDVDGDGDLDLAAGNSGGANSIYVNHGGRLETTASWRSDDWDKGDRDKGDTYQVAWGDVDGDGDLDLAAGNHGARNSVYRNQGGVIEKEASWRSAEADETDSVAWGDVDGDGDLDLASGNGGVTRVHLNSGTGLERRATWSAVELDYITSVAWGDVDGDGDLDLAVGGWRNRGRVYLNQSGRLEEGAGWSSEQQVDIVGTAWGDVDGDGDLDLAAAVWNGNNRVYLNVGGRLTSTVPAVVGVVNGSPCRVAPSIKIEPELAPADGHAVRPLRGHGMAVKYKLNYPVDAYFHEIRAFYAFPREPITATRKWLPATPITGTITRRVRANEPQVFHWDLVADGFAGASDEVVFRVVALPPQAAPQVGGVPGPFTWPYVAAQSYPFRLRGTQVQVLHAGAAVPGLRVYQAAKDEMGVARAIADGNGQPFQTDRQGFLQGHRPLPLGDQLIALMPISSTEVYTAFLSNAGPTELGVDGHAVRPPGVQTLTISPGNRLLLFNLAVSLEWDARREPSVLAQLESALHRTSEAIFDWTNGQAALGDVTIHQDRDRWNDADIRVYASNRLRPSAVLGGVVEPGKIRDDPDNLRLTEAITYTSGQIHIGASWNRFGDAVGSLGEDWSVTLAHELGHYLFFLDDHYLGFDAASGLLKFIDTCTGTAMGDPYLFSEFHHGHGWQADCSETLAQHSTGRWDWQTIERFWDPFLSGERALNGPARFPIALTRVRVLPPQSVTATLPIENPTFDVRACDGPSRNCPPADTQPYARALLFQADRILDLGQPSLGRVRARGARLGDRLCVIELGRAGDRLGCTTIGADENGGGSVPIRVVEDWRPGITIAAAKVPYQSSIADSLAVTVTGRLPARARLKARLYPHDGPASETIDLTPGASAEVHAGSFLTEHLSPPGGSRDAATGVEEETKLPPTGAIHVWVDEPEPRDNQSPPRRELVSEYALGGNPGRLWGSSGRLWGSSGRLWGSAPLMSPDGKVVIYARQLAIRQGDFLALQVAPSVPSGPDCTAVVGHAYRLTASGELMARARESRSPLSIAFNYVGAEVPPGEEHPEWLRIGRWDDRAGAWQMLETVVDTYHNIATARADYTTLYALFAGPPRQVGWSTLSYTGKGGRVQDALGAIEGCYDLVWGQAYDSATKRREWQVYGPSLPAWLSDLARIEYGQTYWVHIVTPGRLWGSSTRAPRRQPPAPDRVADLDQIPSPPALFYGEISGDAFFNPTVGLKLTAWIADRPCGSTLTRPSEDGKTVYGIKVLDDSDASDGARGCGATDRVVRFQVEQQWMAETQPWSNENAWKLSLRPEPRPTPTRRRNQ